MSAFAVFMIALILGVLTEIIASLFSLWRYRKNLYLALNIIVAFTLVQGGLAYYWLTGFSGSNQSYLFLALIGLIGSALGVAYELCNDRLFRLFDFNPKGIWLLESPNQLVVGVGISWGFIPLFALFIHNLFS